MIKHNAQNPPEQYRLIRIRGRGRISGSRFECLGMFRPFDHSAGARFCIRRMSGEFEPDRFTWNDTLEWEYADEG